MSQTAQKMHMVGKKVGKIDYVDSNGYLEKSLMILKTCKNLRLIGETGTGKTKLTHKICESLDTNLFEIVGSVDTSRWDLLASDTLKDGETVIRKGIIIEWLESKKGALYIDGFNYMPQNVVSLIESLGDFRGSIHIPELKCTYKRGSEHYLIISYNPSEKNGYSGTFTENIATIRRFEGIIVDYMNELSETKYLSKFTKNTVFARKLVSLAVKTRNLYKNGELCTPLTTGNLINYANLLESGMSETDIIEVASSLFKESQRGTFKRLWTF